MPLSYFSEFWAAQERDRPGYRKAVELFGRFSLLVFVLYDQQEDHELHGRLGADWSALDGLTGDHLLFFAPVDPPRPWLNDPRVGQREWMRPGWRRDNTAQDRISRERSFMPLDSRTPSATTAAFRKILGVPHGMGSCLVIARTVHDKRVWLLATSAARVGVQLERLGSLASLASRESILDDALGGYVARVAADDDALVDIASLSGTLAGALTEVCAISASSGCVRDELTSHRARVYLCDSVRTRLLASKELDEEATIDELARAGTVVAAMTDADPPSQHHSKASRAVESRRLTHGSLRMSLGGTSPSASFGRLPQPHRRTVELFRMGDHFPEILDAGAFDAIGEPDYRMPVALWSQALEHEMAELLGHEVRAGLGIDLPKYHWRRQPELRGIAIECHSVNGPISFNQARPNSPDPDRAPWQPPAMGPLRLGWEAWRARTDAPVPRELIDLLLRCKEFRNAASHPGEPIGLDSAHEAQRETKRAIAMIGGLGIRSWAREP